MTVEPKSDTWKIKMWESFSGFQDLLIRSVRVANIDRHTDRENENHNHSTETLILSMVFLT